MLSKRNFYKNLGGDVIGVVDESVLIKHKILVPPNIAGTVKFQTPSGQYTVSVSEIFKNLFNFLEKNRSTLWWF